MKEGMPGFLDIHLPFEEPNKGKGTGGGGKDYSAYDKLGKGNTPLDNACWEEGVDSLPERPGSTQPAEPETPPDFGKLPKHHYPKDVGEADWQKRKDLE